MKKTTIFLSALSISTLSWGQIHTESCHAYKQSSSALAISDVLSGEDNYDVNFYKLDLGVSNENTNIDGIVTSKSTASDAVDTMWFHLTDNMNISSCKINGQSYSNYIRLNNLVKVPLSSTINVGDDIDMEIAYSGDAGGTGFFSGYTSDENPYGQKVSWTLSEPFNAKSWFPVKEDLVDKIDSMEMHITTPSGTFGASNGLLQSSTTMTDGRLKNVWKSNYLIDFYLIAFSVADYKEYSYKMLIPSTTDSLLMQSFIYNADYQGQPLVDVAEPYLDEMENMMNIFSDKFGVYPFLNEKYGIMMAPMGGGMEHQTLSTQGYISNVGLTAHELGHQWFGDHVTCSTWNDIWINEGFATYSEYVYLLESGQTSLAFNDLIVNQQTARQSSTGTVYVPDGSGDSRIFSSILTYSKGMAVVHMLRYLLQEDFYPFLTHFQESNAFGNSTTAEFTTLLNNFTGQDYTWFTDEWIYGKGYPKYTVRWKQGTDGVLWVDLDENPSSTDYFTMPLPLRLNFDDGTTEDIDFRPMEGMANVFSSYSSSKTITDIELDPDSWILKGFSSISETYPIGVSEFDLSIIMTQNPSSTLELRNNANELLTIHITDAQGKHLDRVEVDAQSFATFNHTSNWANGLYLLNIEGQNGNATVRKWVKN